jgi:hypothetical protein
MSRSITALLFVFVLGAFAGASIQAQETNYALPLSTEATPIVAAAPPVSSAPSSTPPGVVPGSPLAAALADVKVGPLPPPAQPPEHIPGPYFQHDPLLDLPELPQPGWIAEADVFATNPHVRYWSNIRGPVIFPGGAGDIVSVPGANLSWAASPEILLGYRLPAGFGEFTLSWRYLSSDGTQALPGPDGPSSVHSRVDLTVADLDYRSSEIFWWPCLDTKFWGGFRFANLYFDSEQTTAAALAAKGSGVIDRHVTNRYWGIGPHAGAEVAYFLSGREWSVLGRIEGAAPVGRIRQTFSERTLTGSANAPFSSSQETPMMDVQLGIRWMPNVQTEVFFGYQYEYFWSVGRESSVPVSTSNTTGTQGEFYDHAIVLRVTCGF